jgi:TolB protein
MPIRMTLLVMALAALAAPYAGSTPTSSSGRIAFATDRADNLRRVAFYSVGLEGRRRRFVARPEPPVQWLVRSPDGKLIAYSRSESATSSLFVSGISGEDPIRIAPPEGSFFDPVFSPDGRKLAVTRAVSCGSGCYRVEIDVVRVDGTGLHRVAENGARPSWAPDGRRLVYQVGSDLRVVGTDGRNDRFVAAGVLAQWAPRGNRIVFVASRGGYGAACFVDADGSHEECTHGFSAKSILWAPDGKSIAFRHSRSGKLGILGAHGRHPRLLGGRGDRLTPVAWSPDGRKLAFLQGGERIQILVRDIRRGGPTRQVTHEPKSTYFSNVQWRNGRVSYAARLDANDLEIVVMNGDGTGARALTNNAVPDRQPAWSPDGRELVFARTGGPSVGLRLMKADGSDERALTDSRPFIDWSPAWSPDGSRIAFVRSRTPYEAGTLTIVGRDGTGLRQLSSITPIPSGVSWSPDGKSLVVVTRRLQPFGADLYLVDVQSDTSRRLVTGLSFSTDPAWSPDGNRILFAESCTHPCGSQVSLYEIHPDGTGLRRIVSGVPAVYPRSAWTSDGRILFTRELTAYGMTSQAVTVANDDGTGEVTLTGNLSINIDPAWGG